MESPTFLFTLGGALVVSALVFAVVLRYLWRGATPLRSHVVNGTLVVFSVLFCLLVLEVVFVTLVVHSDGSNQTLVSKHWYEKYWKPINALGYRDYEHQWQERILFVVGDSFMTGHGIKDIEDRLASVLSNKLGDGWSVAVLAENGWNQQTAYEALVRHPQKPDRLIVSYFLNDIVTAARQRGLKRTVVRETPPAWLKPVVDRSYFANWLYWRLRPPRTQEHFWNYFARAYRDAAIWELHTSELRKIIAYAREIDADLAFLLWPRLADVANSREFTAQVASFLETQGVSAIDLSPYLAGRDPKTMVISARDGHPNEALHAEVAALVYERLGPWQ